MATNAKGVTLEYMYAGPLDDEVGAAIRAGNLLPINDLSDHEYQPRLYDEPPKPPPALYPKPPPGDELVVRISLWGNVVVVDVKGATPQTRVREIQEILFRDLHLSEVQSQLLKSSGGLGPPHRPVHPDEYLGKVADREIIMPAVNMANMAQAVETIMTSDEPAARGSCLDSDAAKEAATEASPPEDDDKLPVLGAYEPLELTLGFCRRIVKGPLAKRLAPAMPDPLIIATMYEEEEEAERKVAEEAAAKAGGSPPNVASQPAQAASESKEADDGKEDPEEKSREKELQEHLEKLGKLDPMKHQMLFKCLKSLFQKPLIFPDMKKYKCFRFCNATLKKHVLSYDFAEGLFLYTGYKKNAAGNGMEFRGDIGTLQTVLLEVQHLWASAAKKAAEGPDGDKLPLALGAPVLITPDTSVIKAALMGALHTKMDWTVLGHAGKVGEVVKRIGGKNESITVKIPESGTTVDIPMMCILPCKFLEPCNRGISIRFLERTVKDHKAKCHLTIRDFWRQDVLRGIQDTSCCWAEIQASTDTEFEGKPVWGEVDLIVSYPHDGVRIGRLIEALIFAIDERGLKDARVFIDILSLPPSLVSFPALPTSSLGKQTKSAIMKAKGVVLVVESNSSPDSLKDPWSMILLASCIQAGLYFQAVASKECDRVLFKEVQNSQIGDVLQRHIGQPAKPELVDQVFKTARAINMAVPKQMLRALNRSVLPRLLTRCLENTRAEVGRHHPHFLWAITEVGKALAAHPETKRVGGAMLQLACEDGRALLGPLHIVTSWTRQLSMPFSDLPDLAPREAEILNDFARVMAGVKKSLDPDVALCVYSSLAMYNENSKKPGSMNKAVEYYRDTLMAELMRPNAGDANRTLFLFISNLLDLLKRENRQAEVGSNVLWILKKCKEFQRPFQEGNQRYFLAEQLFESRLCASARQVFEHAASLYTSNSNGSERNAGEAKSVYMQAVCWAPPYEDGTFEGERDEGLAMGLLLSLVQQDQMFTSPNERWERAFQFRANLLLGDLQGRIKVNSHEQLAAYSACVDCGLTWNLRTTNDERFLQFLGLAHRLFNQGQWQLASRCYSRLKGTPGVRTEISAEDPLDCMLYNRIIYNLAEALENTNRFSEAYQLRQELLEFTRQRFGKRSHKTMLHIYRLGLNRSKQMEAFKAAGARVHAATQTSVAEDIFLEAWDLAIEEGLTRWPEKLDKQMSMERQALYQRVSDCGQALLELRYDSGRIDPARLRLLGKEVFALRRQCYPAGNELAQGHTHRQYIRLLMIPERHLSEADRPNRPKLLEEAVAVCKEWISVATDLNQQYSQIEAKVLMFQALMQIRVLTVEELKTVVSDVFEAPGLESQWRNRTAHPNAAAVVVELLDSILKKHEEVKSTVEGMAEVLKKLHAIRGWFPVGGVSTNQQQQPQQGGYGAQGHDFTANQTEMVKMSVNFSWVAGGNGGAAVAQSWTTPANSKLSSILQGVVNIITRTNPALVPAIFGLPMTDGSNKQSLDRLILVATAAPNQELAFDKTFAELGIRSGAVLIARFRRDDEVATSPNKDFNYVSAVSPLPNSGSLGGSAVNQAGRGVRFAVSAEYNQGDWVVVANEPARGKGQIIQVVPGSEQGRIAYTVRFPGGHDPIPMEEVFCARDLRPAKGEEAKDASISPLDKSLGPIAENGSGTGSNGFYGEYFPAGNKSPDTDRLRHDRIERWQNNGSDANGHAHLTEEEQLALVLERSMNEK